MVDMLGLIKTGLIALAAWGIYVAALGAAIEPDRAVWMMAVMGGVLSTTMFNERSIGAVLGHSLLGVFAAIAGSQIIAPLWHVPQPAVALFAGMFSGAGILYTARRIEREGFGWIAQAIADRFFGRDRDRDPRA
jgi:hypothetical protein